jgi:tRNA A-37 threonylcarbamoyl transferase component Bud32
MSEPGPTRLGRYELVTLLGQGGMARVYLGLLRGPGGVNNLVVLKQLRPEMANQKELMAMFFDEARIAARLDHPNVVSTYETLRDGDQSLMVMEYLEGHTLAELLTRVGRPEFPLEEHLWILGQVLTGLAHGHELIDEDGTPLGVVHRDVSPSNVFVTHGGDVKLLDFGLARAAGALSTTHRGKLKGKLAYAAPELFLSRPVDARTDLFAVGTMLWEAIAGRRRVAGESPGEVMEARVAGVESKIRQECPDVPPRLADIVDKATANDPAERFASAAEMLAALDVFGETLTRQAGRREVAALMTEAFRADRVALRQKIDQHVAGTAVPPEETPPPSFELPRTPTRLSTAATVIAAAGTAAVIGGILGSPSRASLLTGPFAGPAVHSVVLETGKDPLPPATPPAPPLPAPPPGKVVALAPRPTVPAPPPARPAAALPRSSTVVLEDRPPQTTRVRTSVRTSPDPRRGPEPGTDLQRTDSNGRQLDEKDPYAP